MSDADTPSSGASPPPEAPRDQGTPGPNLGRMAKPQPKPRHRADPADADAVEGGGGSGSATGFVSMLAKRQFDAEAAEALAATAEDEAVRRERLHMAREVVLPGSAAAGAGSGSPAEAMPTAGSVPVAAMEKAVPGWYRAGLVVMLIMAVLLLGIGLWAIGALGYMARVSPVVPQDVHYPLISWRLDVGTMGGYTAASRVMAWAMLLCVPVAGMLVVMAWMLRQRMKA